MPNIEPRKNISTLYTNIKTIIDTSKEQATIQLNNTMVLSYWDIGRELKEVVKKISEKLYTFFDKEICATLSHKFSWSHFVKTRIYFTLAII